jgi:signal peptidase I
MNGQAWSRDGARMNDSGREGTTDAGSPDGETAASIPDDSTPADDTPAEGAPAAAGKRLVRRRRRKRSFWREFPILVVVALLLAVLIKTFALQAFFIPSASMEQTLDINDRVLINKLVYDFRDIHRGDIVVFNGDGSWDPGTVPTKGNPFSDFFSNFAGMFGFGHPGDIYVKRVIGLPGDHVACCDAQGRVTVNGVPLNEGSYLYPGDVPSQSRFDIVVPQGQLWVMGDHRSVSADSREHMGDPGGGTIPESAVLGRAFIIIWPPSRWRILPIPATFEQPALNTKVSSSASAMAADQDLNGVLGARLPPAGPALPLSLGFAGAVPLTWAQYRLRRRWRLRRCIRREEGESP